MNHVTRGLMQDRPLTIPTLLSRVETNFGHKRVVTGDTVSTWSEVAPRVRRLARALDRLAEGAPLWRIHELVFAILATESEPVDPRL